MKNNMQAKTKTILIASVILLIGLISSASVIYTTNSKNSSHCGLSLPIKTMLVLPQDQSTYLTPELFHSMVEDAVNDWERQTGLNLFTVLSREDYLNRSGLVNLVIATPIEFASLEPNGTEIGRTLSKTTDKGTVVSFIAELYNFDYNTLHNTLLHELGHARGIGHSPNKDDIMYSDQLDNEIHDLSSGDIKAMIDYCNSQ